MSIEELSKCSLAERERLIEAYFGALPVDNPISMEQIAERIGQMEEEYKVFLVKLFYQSDTIDEQTIYSVVDKNINRYALGGEYAPTLKEASANAEQITLWEQITNSNDRDVKHLNALVVAYARDLLAHITRDVLEEVKL